MSSFFKNFKESEESYTEVSISNMQNRIIELLETNKMTKADLARKMGISKQHLNDFFNKGHNATFKTIGKVAYALNKKVVISFVEKNTDNKSFYNYVKDYETFKNTPAKDLMVVMTSFKNLSSTYDHYKVKNQQSAWKAHKIEPGGYTTKNQEGQVA